MILELSSVEGQVIVVNFIVPQAKALIDISVETRAVLLEQITASRTLCWLHCFDWRV